MAHVSERPDVFISYSRADYFDKQENIIPGNPITKVMAAFDDAGISYWIDKRGIKYGESFGDKIEANIKSSEIFLFISTSNSNQPECWTGKEVCLAAEYKKIIIPLLVDNSESKGQVKLAIAGTNRIGYNAMDPAKTMKELVTSINELLADKREQERHIKLEQDRVSAEIDSRTAELKTSVAAVEALYKQLKSKVLDIKDGKERDRLTKLVEDSFLTSENTSDLREKLNNLRKENGNQKQEINRLKQELAAMSMKTYAAPQEQKTTGRKIFNIILYIFAALGAIVLLGILFGGFM